MASAGLNASKVAELVEAAATVAGAGDLRHLLELLVETGMDLTGARYGALGVLGEHGHLRDFVHRGMDEETVRRLGAPPSGKGLLGTITKAGHAVRVGSIADHEDSYGFPDGHPQMGSFLGVPIEVGETVFGNLYLTEKAGGFSDEDMTVVIALAKIGGTAIWTNRMHGRLRTVALVEERERIARDLHDAIIQDLFAVGLKVEAEASKVEDESTRQNLRDAVERIDQAMTDLRQFIFQLRPAVWTRVRLQDELVSTISDLAEPFSRPVAVHVEGRVDDLPPGIAEEIMAIANESTVNALKHAQADFIEVSVAYQDGFVVIVTRDNGTGFDPGKKSSGMGLENLRSRAADLAGELKIDSMPGQGTVIEVRFPA